MIDRDYDRIKEEEYLNEDDPDEQKEDKEADYYDQWREDCAIEFDEELNKLIKKYKDEPNHYMNKKDHVVGALIAHAEYMEKYEDWNKKEGDLK